MYKIPGYEIPGVFLNNSLVIDFPLSFFKELQVQRDDASRPLLLMVSKGRSVLIDLQAFIVPGIKPARCWVNRKIYTPEGAVSYGLAGVPDLIDGADLEKHAAEIAILLSDRAVSVSGLLPALALRDTMISYEHFAIAIDYLKTFESKADNVVDFMLFFSAFIQELKSQHDQGEENLKRVAVWRLFPKCAKIVDLDRNEDPVPLDAAEKQRWTDLLASIKSECRIR